MKKITTLLLLSLVFVSFASAVDVVLDGWFETKGELYKTVGDNDPTTKFGSNDFSVNVKVNGEGFGGEMGVGGWYPGEFVPSSSDFKVKQAYLWTDFNSSGMFKLFAGNDMEVISYSPNAIEGELFNDAFGLGLGRYDFQAMGNGYTGAKDGLIAEINLNNLSAAFVYSLGGGSEIVLEDNLKNAININFKYNMDSFGQIYAGYTPREDDGSLWIATSIKIIPQLLADIKFESTLTKDANVKWISANLGYDIKNFVNLVSETTYKITETQNDYFFGLKATPVVPVIGLDIEASVSGNDTNDILGIGAAGVIKKSFGNLSTSLALTLSTSTADDAEATIATSYKINMWF
ncbi:hypothetical protein EW093_07805 [Thiospirochaeta perfilievii]|uniref:Autotransporter outer membrane beta-barrel domain-containing protein n=1 Tax=Thiospirochaeta perfilievii TaxID=252967 RepID=A0A5C1QBZ4_9SPIO|nr:hypothetical protein [Thiospirochaeta perfilievii]QEN04610.1 hypothetical protein EW093_07805 [Thiospirochaeta perfilievii]